MRIIAVLALFFATSCAAAPAPDANMDIALPDLPQPLANNAVAVLHGAEGPTLFTFLGLGADKTFRDIVNLAFMLPPGAEVWQPLPPAPGPGRLAGTAAGLGGQVFLFGGYTVAGDGSEKSIETVHAFDPVTGQYDQWPPMPVPVDDAVSAVVADRYIYLISGWHDTGNVNLVQVLDTQKRRWFQATPWPGAPVFGHAGGSAGNTLIICDGVRVVTTTAKRRFEATGDCFRGDIDAAKPAKIDWTTLPPHPGPALYRAAAVGVDGRVLFTGGSDNPYNFNGIGYDGRPSDASAAVFAFDVAAGTWRELSPLARASMDHRGLLPLGDGRFAIVGGMRDGQRVSAAVQVFRVE